MKIVFKTKHLLFGFLLFSLVLGHTQNEVKSNLPYHEIPDHPTAYTSGSVAARMVDGLGFRFYWASYDLTKEDLAYKISKDARSAGETIDHIYDLSKVILNSTLKQLNKREAETEMTFEEKRAKTLINLQTAADILRESDDNSQYEIIFGEQKIPFWNTINGPIADAIWHCGQLVSYRRANGNPINPFINQLTGKVRN